MPGGDQRPTELRAAAGPLTSAVLWRIASPRVKADPQQAGEHGVWTTRNDVLPGAPIRDGERVVARWGEVRWVGKARWDPHDPDLLWLTPDETSPLPRLAATYPTEELLAGVLEALTDDGITPHGPAATAPAIATGLRHMIADVETALALLIRAATAPPAQVDFY